MTKVYGVPATRGLLNTLSEVRNIVGLHWHKGSMYEYSVGDFDKPPPIVGVCLLAATRLVTEQAEKYNAERVAFDYKTVSNKYYSPAIQAMTRAVRYRGFSDIALFNDSRNTDYHRMMDMLDTMISRTRSALRKDGVKV